MVTVQNKVKINHEPSTTYCSLKSIIHAGIAVTLFGTMMLWKARFGENKDELPLVASTTSSAAILIASLNPTNAPIASDKMAEQFDSSAPTTTSTLSHETSKAVYFNPLENAISKLASQTQRPKRFCPCCGWSGEMFDGKTFSGVGKTIPDRRCPRCRTLERHRKACAMFGCRSKTSSPNNHTLLANRIHEDTPFRLLHFGPEKAMVKYIDSFLPSIAQVGVDFFAEGYSSSLYDKERTLHADVTNLKFPDNFANGIIILHVLEHIPVLETAINELIRVLSPGGWAMIEVPCMKEGDTKDCRHLKNSTEDLIECAGQRDHVWKFNCIDFKDRLEENSSLECETWYQLDQQKDCLDANFRQAILPTKVGITVPTLLCHNRKQN